ncbi:MAG: hypothetical protein R3C10_11810 [Pirellulales bacterium]
MQPEHFEHDTVTRELDHSDVLTREQLADLADPDKQAEYLRAYLEQLARQACPGCGDS